MDRVLAAVFLTVWGMTLADSGAFDLSSLGAEDRLGLEQGGVIFLTKRPDETGEPDSRFVTVAQILDGNRKELWEVIHDKEGAEEFVDGVLESEVVETSPNEIVVDQRTHVGGPKGAYRYRLRHRLTPMERSDFTYVSGEIRDVIGTWWIFEGPDESSSLVIYSLHIDPGFYAPQFVVQRGMKKTMPNTLAAMEREVLRRRGSP